VRLDSKIIGVWILQITNQEISLKPVPVGQRFCWYQGAGRSCSSMLSFIA